MPDSENWKDIENDIRSELHRLIDADDIDVDELVRTSLRNYYILFAEIHRTREKYNMLWKSYADLTHRERRRERC
tara:strand:- start:5885 stop:6109 length:225 start_codon:yes stop_codon:yes gene_type:complete